MIALLRRHPGLRGFPHVDLGVRETPVELHRIAGRDVLVKRDDRTSGVYGGNKVRCLEHLLASPARRLLTFSSLGAHHAYAVAVHGARRGMPTDAILVRLGPRGPLAAETRRIAARCLEVDGAASAALAALRLWRPGTRVIPPGGLSPRGCLGYVTAAFEIDEVPPTIYVPLGTGTTVTGLLAGLWLRGARTELVAVRVADAVAGWPWLIRRRARRALALLRAHDPSIPHVDEGSVALRVVAAEGAYGTATAAARAAVEAARPLRLEPVYTGKTLAVLLAEDRPGSLFLNTYAPFRADSP
jgi:D-cysteine desulfhydrase